MRTPERAKFWGGPYDGLPVGGTVVSGSIQRPERMKVRALPIYDDAGRIIPRLGAFELYECGPDEIWRWRGTFVPADGQAA